MQFFPLRVCQGGHLKRGCLGIGCRETHGGPDGAGRMW